MADFFAVVAGRRSIRKFKPDPVPLADLEEMVRWATHAPSASNAQNWHFVIVRRRDLIERMHQAVAQRIDYLASQAPKETLGNFAALKYFATVFAKAPAVIAVFYGPYHGQLDKALQAVGHTSRDQFASYAFPGIQSVGAAIQTLCLSAYALGYGTVWMCAPLVAAEDIAALLAVDEPWRLAALVPVGKPDEEPAPRPRKPIDEVLTVIE